jgi:ABC-2 type transport system ATP-binding protein
MQAIEVLGLSKSFLKEQVLQDISLTIPEGKIFGFLGPNGAGKTTTVRLLNGILRPDAGTIRILGRDLEESDREIRQSCGVMTENAALYERLTAIQNLEFFSQLYRIPRKKASEKILDLLKLFDLDQAADKMVKHFSTGMKKRLSLARALIHEPKILFLDEPTSGLDPEGAASVNQFIAKISREQGVTVFLCTHQLRYAEDICSLYGFLSRGKLIASGSLQELLAQKKESLNLQIRGKNLPGKDPLNFTQQIKNDGEAGKIIQDLISQGAEIFEARQTRWSLEELYFSFQRDFQKGAGQ